MTTKPVSDAIRILAPRFSRRFSGITTSMIAVVPEQAKRLPIVACDPSLPARVPQVGMWEMLKLARRGPWRIWHARRNQEMLIGLMLRYVLRFPIILLWTSAALRRHSRLTRFYYRHMDGLIATTAKAAAFLDRPATVVRHGVDTEVFSPPSSETERERNWLEKDLGGRYGIGVFGRVRPSKGTDLYIEALCRVLPARPGWHAVVIGDTLPQHQAFAKGLRERVAQAGLADRIHFIGKVEDFAEIPHWYRSLSLVVCPSREEGFGLTSLEAMASGCPVVVSEAGAYPEIVTAGKEGWVVPCGEVEPMAAAIEDATADIGRLRELGRQAHATVQQRFRIANEAAGIEAVYRDLFDRFGQPLAGGD